MDFKFQSRYFCFDSDGYFYLTDSISNAYNNSRARCLFATKPVYVLCTATCRLERYIYDEKTTKITLESINYTNPNIELF